MTLPPHEVLPPSELLQAARKRPPTTAIVLGSGLGPIANRIAIEVTVPFEQCPPLARCHVDGHGGRLVLGDWAGQRVLVFQGRNHYYEGHAWSVVATPVRLAKQLGAQCLICTNAAGGIRADLTPGTLVYLASHLNWSQGNPCQAAYSQRPYDESLRDRLRGVAMGQDLKLAEGTYAAVTGPNYETPAEIRALRALGIDCVGMSTACELEESARMGLPCAALACITNRAAGLGDHPLTHEEVLATSRRQADRLGALLERFLAS